MNGRRLSYGGSHVKPSEVVRGHETTVIQGRCNDRFFCVRGSVGVHTTTNITGPSAVIANLFKILLFQELVLHVAKHGGGTSAHATCC